MPSNKNVHIADRRGHREYSESTMELNLEFMTPNNKTSFASSENNFGLDLDSQDVQPTTHTTDFADIAFPGSDDRFISFARDFYPVAQHATVTDPTTSTVGVKFDSGKPDLSLIPPEIIESLGQVLSFGANKYASRNWERGLSYSRVFASLNRHIWAWWDPTKSDKDPETGLSHLAHAACCIAFLLSYEARGYVDFDDRPADRDGCRSS